jgi:hypothetical protein
MWDEALGFACTEGKLLSRLHCGTVVPYVGNTPKKTALTQPQKTY